MEEEEDGRRSRSPILLFLPLPVHFSRMATVAAVSRRLGLFLPANENRGVGAMESV